MPLKIAVLMMVGIAVSGWQMYLADNSDRLILSTDEVDYGSTPFIDPGANAQVESAVEALQTGMFPERLSVLMYSGKPFDLKEYRRDPEAYLNIAEPGRAFQPAQPKRGITRLAPNCRPYQKVAQGGWVELSVRGVPHTPVTFTSMDLGIFENQLTTITVDTDDNGVARVRMIGTMGTINDVNILAASPVTSGQVKFVVVVQAQSKQPS